MTNLKNRSLIVASGEYLSEPLTEDLINANHEVIYDFIENNKYLRVEDYPPEKIWELIVELAETIEKFVNSEVNLALEIAKEPLYLVEVKIKCGDIEKSSKSLIKAPTSEKAEHYAIYCEMHDPDKAEWCENHSALDLGGEYGYCAFAQQVDPSDEVFIKKYFLVHHYCEKELKSSGNYTEFF